MSNDGRLAERTDGELMRLARRDSGAFRAIYDRHSVRLHSFLLRRTGDAASAFELTAETFARAWLSRERFTDHGEGAAPWLFGIARNLLSESVRKQRIECAGRKRVDMQYAEESAAPRETWLIGLDDDLEEALSELPPDHRRAVEMRVMDRSDYAEMARELDISPGAARVRVHRGLAALKRLLASGRTRPMSSSPMSRKTGDA